MPDASVCQGERCRSWVVTGADGGDSRDGCALPAETATDCGKPSVEALAETGRRVAEQQMYRALVDHACAMERGPTARDGWAEEVPKLRASWRDAQGEIRV